MRPIYEFLDEKTLMDRAAPKDYIDGAAAAEHGSVRILEYDERHLRAQVEDTQIFEAELHVDHDDLGWSCTCGEAVGTSVGTWWRRRSPRGRTNLRGRSRRSTDRPVIGMAARARRVAARGIADPESRQGFGPCGARRPPSQQAQPESVDRASRCGRAWVCRCTSPRSPTWCSPRYGVTKRARRPSSTTPRSSTGVVHQTRPNHTQVRFWSADIAADVQELVGRGVVFNELEIGATKTVDHVLTSPDIGKSAWFKDPDGKTPALFQAE